MVSVYGAAQRHAPLAQVEQAVGHLRVLEKGVFFNPLGEHQLVVAVSGPVEEVLHQVLVVLKNTLWNHEKQGTYADAAHPDFPGKVRDLDGAERGQVIVQAQVLAQRRRFTGVDLDKPETASICLRCG